MNVSAGFDKLILDRLQLVLLTINLNDFVRTIVLLRLHLLLMFRFCDKLAIQAPSLVTILK
tara:strand:+ start:1675 stop:1857 length:183 start_codon:yes stop_codon:yes gene_type:complete